MNSNLKVQSVQQAPQLQQVTMEHKKFVQDSFQIDYTNSSKIYYEHCPKIHDVKINNYLCYQQGHTLFKITEILYEDKIIRIEDRFEVTADPVQPVSKASAGEEKMSKKQKNYTRSIQKVRIFCKNSGKDSKAERRDKKNIVKNIVKIFSAWLEKKCDSILQQNALQQLKKLLKTEKFNNRLIKKIISSQVINKCFLRFIEDDAEEQIKYSRIQDKESHYEVLQIYKGLLQQSKSNSSLSFVSSQQEDGSESVSAAGVRKMSQRNQKTQSASMGHEVNIEAIVKEKADTSDSSRKNKVILIQNGSESSSNK